MGPKFSDSDKIHFSTSPPLVLMPTKDKSWKRNENHLGEPNQIQTNHSSPPLQIDDIEALRS